MNGQAFANGHRVIYVSDFYGRNTGTVVQAIDTPNGWFYNVRLDKELPGAFCWKVVQLHAENLVPNAALRGDSGLIAGVPLESTVIHGG